MLVVPQLKRAQYATEPLRMIGGVARELERELNASMPANLEGRRLVEGDFNPAPAVAVWQKFDERYSTSDYLLWRGALRPYFAGNNPWLWPRPTAYSRRWRDLEYLARITANNTDEAIVWGAIGIATEISRHSRNPQHIVKYPFVPAFMNALRSRLLSGLKPLPQCSRSCGFAAALFLQEFRRHCEASGSPLKQEQLGNFLNELSGYIAWIDPNWWPGKKLDTRDIEVEHNSYNRLQPYHSLTQFQNLIWLLKDVRSLVAPTIKEIDSEAETLLVRAADFAYSAWLTAKSFRIDQMQFDQKKADDLGRTPRLQNAEKLELACLLDLHHSLKEAGAWLESAYYLHIHTRIVSDPMASGEEYQKFQRNKTRIFKFIKEAGLEVDERFKTRDRVTIRNEDGIRAITELLGRLSGQPAKSANLIPSVRFGSRRSISHERNSREIEGLRLAFDQSRDPDWKMLQEVVPGLPWLTPFETLMALISAAADHAESAALFPPDMLRAASRLSRKYALVRSSFKIFKRLLMRGEYTPASDDLIQLVGILTSCMQLNPLAINLSKMHKWQGLVYAGWRKKQLSESAGIEPMNRLLLHEVLMGRATIGRSKASSETAKLLFEKSLSMHSVSGLRDLYLKDVDFRRRGSRLVQPATLGKFSRGFAESKLGSPCFVSIFRSADRFSIVAVDSQGQITAPLCELVVPSFAQDAANFLRRRNEWFIDRGADFAQQVIWPKSFIQLAEHVVDCLRKTQSLDRSIILAVSPELTAFPLQHLFSLFGEIAISLVPCLGWAPLWRYERVAANGSLSFSISCFGDEALESVGPVIKNQLKNASNLPIDARVLFGHGDRQSERGFPLPRIRVGNGFVSSLDAWSRVLRRRLVVIHACQSGLQKTVFPRDFGGLPGIALGLGCRGFFAPITDVPPDVAEVLNRHLFSADGPEQIGSRYRAAISELPAVCLYNLFGVANESIFVESSRQTLE